MRDPEMETQPAQAMAGIKVLDLSRVLAGPWSTQILADFGADVVKIEAPGAGDDTRAWGPPNLAPEAGSDAPGLSAYYLACNRNKRSVAIDLANPEGAELVRRLSLGADVVVENFKRGGLTKYGLDYDRLKAGNPRLVYCSITGFGQTGPYADRPGYDYVAQAMGGLMSLTGEKDGPPIKSGVAIADLSTGLYATVSILMALRHAERTGQGQHIDCSLLDTQIAMLANQGMSHLVSGVSPTRLGNGHPTVVPYRVFEAKDGPIVVAVGNNGQFAALCKIMGVPELAQDPRYATNPARLSHRDTLEATLEALLIQRDAGPLLEEMARSGVPGGPINTVGQIFADPFVEARQTVHHFEREDGVQIPSVAFPAKLSLTPTTFRNPPPDLGQHTFEALSDWLNTEPETLNALRDAGVIAGG
jgi:crotonobetainyl-CoA:carnitine CoA-transferase CaiB-like acyl-CoA transferase